MLRLGSVGIAGLFSSIVLLVCIIVSYSTCDWLVSSEVTIGLWRMCSGINGSISLHHNNLTEKFQFGGEYKL